MSMTDFFVQMGWCEKHGNSCKINKDAVEAMREEVDDRDSFVVPAGHAGEVRNIFFIKIGYMKTWSRTMWKDYSEHPRRVHPHAELVS